MLDIAPHSKALMREAYEQNRRGESPDELAEIVQHATDAIAHPARGFSREESNARAATGRTSAGAA